MKLIYRRMFIFSMVGTTAVQRVVGRRKREKNGKGAAVDRERVSGELANGDRQCPNLGIFPYSDRIRIVLGTELKPPA